MDFYSQGDLSRKIGLNLRKPTALVTYHPATAEREVGVEQQIDALLEALGRFKNLQIIFTAPGVEESSGIIFKKVKQFVSQNKDRAKFFETLGGKLYLSLMKNVKCVIGNSSSGIIEAPALKTPTINIGNRQKGRVKAKSIIDVGYDVDEIFNSLYKIIDNPMLSEMMVSNGYLLEGGYVSKRIVQAIKENLKNSNLMNKKLDFKVNENEWHRYF